MSEKQQVAPETEPTGTPQEPEQNPNTLQAPAGGGGGEATIQPEVDWKARAREWEKRAKVNSDAAAKLAEVEESQKSEAQKIADRAANAERERDEARADGVRYRTAAKFGIDEEHFDLLGGGDEEAITDRAERLSALLKLRTENDDLRAQLEALQQGKPSNVRPVPNLKPGATPEQNDPEEAEYALYAGRFGR